MDLIVKIVRSIACRQKGGMTAKRIESEYLEIEGSNIPFGDFGFQSVEELLIASGEFEFHENKCFSPKVKESSAHMSRMNRDEDERKRNKNLRKAKRDKLEEDLREFGKAEKEEEMMERLIAIIGQCEVGDPISTIAARFE